MPMNILSAYAVYGGRYHPMFPTGSGASTGLLRLGTSDEDGNWTEHRDASGLEEAQVSIRRWLEVSLGALPAFDAANPDASHVVMDGDGGVAPPPDRVTKESPWYAIFQIDSTEMIGAKEIWVGRFMHATTSFGEPGSSGVFYFYEGQSIDGSADQPAPTQVAKRAESSVIFANYDAADGPTAEAKEQGCRIEGSSYRNIWPVHD